MAAEEAFGDEHIRWRRRPRRGICRHVCRGFHPPSHGMELCPSGHFALRVRFAKAAGATVIATSSSDEKLARLKDLGADHLINYKSEPKWGRSAAAVAGQGVDAVVEVGGPGTLSQSIHACRIGGHISLIGVLTGVAGEVPTALAMSKNVTIKGNTWLSPQLTPTASGRLSTRHSRWIRSRLLSGIRFRKVTSERSALHCDKRHPAEDRLRAGLDGAPLRARQPARTALGSVARSWSLAASLVFRQRRTA